MAITHKQLQEKLEAGENITIEGNRISATGQLSVDYSDITNKPTIDGVELRKGSTHSELGLLSSEDKSELENKINEKADTKVLDLYQKKLTAGTGITIDQSTNTISSTGGSTTVSGIGYVDAKATTQEGVTNYSVSLKNTMITPEPYEDSTNLFTSGGAYKLKQSIDNIAPKIFETTTSVTDPLIQKWVPQITKEMFDEMFSLTYDGKVVRLRVDDSEHRIYAIYDVRQSNRYNDVVEEPSLYIMVRNSYLVRYYLDSDSNVTTEVHPFISHMYKHRIEFQYSRNVSFEGETKLYGVNFGQFYILTDNKKEINDYPTFIDHDNKNKIINGYIDLVEIEGTNTYRCEFDYRDGSDGKLWFYVQVGDSVKILGIDPFTYMSFDDVEIIDLAGSENLY